MSQTNIKEEFSQLGSMAETLEATGNYDVDSLISGLKQMIRGNIFFYGTLAKKYPEKDPSRVFYDLKVNPHEHQLVYVQLGCGYAKETRAPHWCYVLKNVGQKMTVIPVTSVKEYSGPARAPFELDIEEEDGIIGRLHFDDIRSIDKMRVIETKGYKEVNTSEEEIIAAYRTYMGI